ncbi:blue light photoreceptor cryptochrome [Parvularcula bermudensis HTCC2503]|uniref:Deoxyribodipyrimidine photo-lyase n=1 Tax=Parvularcula bermudensis (strain ATCC BAA-594 / HTCC2503 / KCTC 12087) TaxID=314260 RepID=E0TD72_PARBH|nr:deoxyribodipyrimidine photo-lyase [Parvularcula bermudensis]ADM09895.1 blue light photoreceptor cryptochrome [Parvularcula bermudensis HTCC2503]
MTDPVILWLREDLRFDDNPAMREAAASGAPVLCLYVLDDATAGDFAMGAAQRWWLHHSLCAFKEDLETRGGALILRRGKETEIVPALAKEIKASHVFWNRRYMKWQTDPDTEIKSALQDMGIKGISCNGRLLYEPWEIETKSGDPYKVYTPYWKSLQQKEGPRAALPRTDKLNAPPSLPSTDRLDDWNLLPRSPNWAEGFEPVWTPGEKGARARLRAWLDTDAASYDDCRNRPDQDRTSRLSPHLHFGEISPVVLWHSVSDAMEAGDIPKDQGTSFLSEIAWREFSYQLLYYHPTMRDQPLMEKFTDFEWDTDKKALNAWQRGRTGYPIVDAGMRQLWTEGWMHNRVRMIVGSFLVKDLLLDWRDGMRWFWDCLVDADPANNTASWQWIAGCGADAAPFFRIFNPTTQSEKFDPDGAYIRRYVPELRDLPTRFIHEPRKASTAILKDAGIVLGETYPDPIVDHSDRRKQALSRYEAIK